MSDSGSSQTKSALNAIRSGDPGAAEQLLPLVYNELRRLAASRMRRESPDHTLGATALVHEAYLLAAAPRTGKAGPIFSQPPRPQ